MAEQIGKALESFAPFFLGKIEELVDRAVSEKLSSIVEEEFNKRFF